MPILPANPKKQEKLGFVNKVTHNGLALPKYRRASLRWLVSFASALSLHWFVDCGFGLYRRVLSYFEESFHGQQTLRGQLALFFP